MGNRGYNAEQIFSAIAKVEQGSTKSAAAKSAGCSTAVLNRWLAKFGGKSLQEIATACQRPDNRYVQIMRELFRRHTSNGEQEFEWDRKELSRIAESLQLSEPANIGDNIYAIRHGRQELPPEITALAGNKHWLLLPSGRSKYKFVKAAHFVLEESKYRSSIKIPDATPQIVGRYALGDEQAVLARVRYNRLIDMFLGIVAFPLQSHLRTTVETFARSQIETDELYVGVDKSGVQYILPVQAKSIRDRIGAVQAIQDVYSCREKFPDLCCRVIAAKTVKKTPGEESEFYTIALLELSITEPWDVHIVREEHYQLVPANHISPAELQSYRVASGQAASGAAP